MKRFFERHRWIGSALASGPWLFATLLGPIGCESDDDSGSGGSAGQTGSSSGGSGGSTSSTGNAMGGAGGGGNSGETGAAGEGAGGAAGSGGAGAELPNIVTIMADDLGFSDLGAFGGEISTPNLDTIAAEGRILTGRRSGSLCAPTRAMPSSRPSRLASRPSTKPR